MAATNEQFYGLVREECTESFLADVVEDVATAIESYIAAVEEGGDDLALAQEANRALPRAAELVASLIAAQAGRLT